MKQPCALMIAVPLALSVIACSTYPAEGGAERSAVDGNAVSGGDPTTNSAGEASVAEDISSSEPAGGDRVSQAEKDRFLQSINFCKEDDLGQFVGMQASEETVAEAMAASNSKISRVLAPGQAATMDYLTNRLNVMTDENGIIIRLRCG